MKNILLIFLLSLSGSLIGQQFPLLEGELLNSKSISLPEGCIGKYSLLGLAYSQKAEENLRSWYDPAIDKFILKRGMFDSEYDVNIFFIPMFHGVTKVTYAKSFKKVKQLTDERLWEHVIYYKGEIASYKESLGFEGKDKPLFLLLDPEGNILEKFSGRYKEEYFETVTNIIDGE